jgi:hypothetical protein
MQKLRLFFLASLALGLTAAPALAHPATTTTLAPTTTVAPTTTTLAPTTTTEVVSTTVPTTLATTTTEVPTTTTEVAPIGINCSSFMLQEDAQQYFDQHPGDPEGLDGPIGPAFDGVQNVACEALPHRSVAPATTTTTTTTVTVGRPLALTGTNTAGWAGAGLLALVAGGACLAAERRRASSDAT